MPRPNSDLYVKLTKSYLNRRSEFITLELLILGPPPNPVLDRSIAITGFLFIYPVIYQFNIVFAI